MGCQRNDSMEKVTMQLNDTTSEVLQPKVMNYKDLGVIISNDLWVKGNCKTAAAEGFRNL